MPRLVDFLPVLASPTHTVHALFVEAPFFLLFLLSLTKPVKSGGAKKKKKKNGSTGSVT
jgi:hypothetical protein